MKNVTKFQSILSFITIFLFINHATLSQTKQNPNECKAYAFAGEIRNNKVLFQIVPRYLPFHADSWSLKVWSDDESEAYDAGGLELDFDTGTYRPVQHIMELSPGKNYYYRLNYYRGDSTFSCPEGSFRMPMPEGGQPVSFVMATGMNWERFSMGRNFDGKGAANEKELELGFPAFEAISKIEPDYFIGNGDNVYYDQPKEQAAETSREMAMKWHRLWSQARFADMARHTATYWLKDDHDYRYNDADTLDHNMSPSHKTGIRLFRQMAPVAYSAQEPTYRTIRFGDDLQIWFAENRDYRSPNEQPDGPDKSIWGAEQREWLESSLLQSNATFKMLISPTPMIGPDDAYKRDNHANTEGFNRERNEFFKFIRDRDMESSFFILCGDRHWQYHSIHPVGIEEFSCGALVQQNARAGRQPGDEKSTDPKARIRQPYVQNQAQAGFMFFELAYENEAPMLHIVFYDHEGNELYRVGKKKSE